nr:hypothetical protein [Rhodococcus sp. (in: high G+C Gram-positive bacteria)]
MGSFARIQITSYELEDVVANNADILAEAELLNLNELVGHFLLQTDSNGLEYVFEMSENEVLRAFSDLEVEYSEWGSEDDDEDETYPCGCPLYTFDAAICTAPVVDRHA